jgi:hypothetical protein
VNGTMQFKEGGSPTRKTRCPERFLDVRPQVKSTTEIGEAPCQTGISFARPSPMSNIKTTTRLPAVSATAAIRHLAGSRYRLEASGTALHPIVKRTLPSGYERQVECLLEKQPEAICLPRARAYPC